MFAGINSRLKKWFNATGKPKTSGYEHGPSGLIYSNWHRRPPWSYWYADLMLLDPQVWFGLMIGNGPLMSAKVKVKCKSPEIKKFVEDQWNRIWAKSAAQILRTKQYGFLAFEVVCKEIDGRIEFDYLRDFHPVDVGQLRDRKSGARVGIRVRQVMNAGPGIVDLHGPKSLWLTYDQEFSRSWGRALLERCYAPWYDKNSDGGALDLRRLHGFKDAWIGDVIKYPNRIFNTDGGEKVHGRDLAREIAENRASGGVVCMPSTIDKDTNKPEWEYQPPSTTGGSTAIPDWIHDLDWDILDGLLVPKEVVEAGGSGGGWSGRSVPWVGFLAVRDQEFSGYVRSITAQHLKPLALVNFGKYGNDFDVEAVPLIETMGQQVGEMGKPELSKPEPAGQPLKPQPEAEEPKPEEADQFSAQRGLFDEDEHPRGQPENAGQFVKKGATKFENNSGKQKNLLHGLDALPGQKDLFKGLDKKEGDEEEEDKPKSEVRKLDVSHSEYGGKHQFIFKSGGKEVGEISIAPRDDGNFEVSNVLVWPQFQRQGNGTQLYRHAYDFAKSQGKSLFISNDRTDDAKALHKTLESKGVLSQGGKISFGENESGTDKDSKAASEPPKKDESPSKAEAKKDEKSPREVARDLGRAGKTRQQVIENVTKGTKSGNLTHDEAVRCSYEYTGTNAGDWNAVAVKKFAETNDDRGNKITVPEFDFPSGYKPVKPFFESSAQNPCCELCGHSIKNAYHIQNDKEELTMTVGSECVTQFGEGKSGKRLEKEAMWNANRDVLKQTWDARDKLAEEFGYEDHVTKQRIIFNEAGIESRLYHSMGYKHGDKIPEAVRKEVSAKSKKVLKAWKEANALAFNSKGAPVHHEKYTHVTTRWNQPPMGHGRGGHVPVRNTYEAATNSAISAWISRNGDRVRKLLDEVDELAPKPTASPELIDAKQFSTSSESGWITIGGHRGPDGKKHGGTPVKISGGKITAGPKHLTGKTLKGLAKVKPHAELRRAVKSAAKEHDLPERDLHDAVEFVHSERAKIHGEREAAKESARKKTGLTAGDISRVANAGHDYSSAHKVGGATGDKLRHFDEYAQEVAREHPELGLGDPDDPHANFSEGLWNVLSEGKLETPAKHHPDTIEEAVNLLHSARKYQPSEEDAVPFSIADPPLTSRSKAAQDKEKPVEAATELSRAIQARLAKLLKKN
jgi:GNAT superfamily N-acetyltransferase